MGWLESPHAMAMGEGAGLHTVLVVDDTPQNLTVLGELLRPHYRVRVAHNGQRALKAVASEPRPDLILLDIMMPVMDGYEVLRTLRADPSTHDIPVIFITALSGDDDELTGLELGAVDYIAKPFNPAIVLARVATQLELKVARERLADQNAWLEHELALRMQENLLVQDLSLRALASLAEARDYETGLHILRTQTYVELLGQQLSPNPRFAAALTPDRLELIVKAAPLHDIGKVGVPDAILLKPSRLSSDEWTIMKQHTTIGALALDRAMAQATATLESADTRVTEGALKFLQVAREIAMYHHEKWDGSGYPDGLTGDAIPVSARLMALADVFDALMSKRVYKEACGFDETTSIIAQGRGTHFDPDVVDAFMACQAAFADVASRLADPPSAP